MSPLQCLPPEPQKTREQARLKRGQGRTFEDFEPLCWARPDVKVKVSVNVNVSVNDNVFSRRLTDRVLGGSKAPDNLLTSSDPGSWGAPVATGEWSWPNGQERRDVSFTPKAGRYVYFRRITAWGWFSPPGYACANEIWVYEQAADTEIAKSVMTLSGSSADAVWTYDKAKDGLSADPGWSNTSYQSATEFLRIDLGSPKAGRYIYLRRVKAYGWFSEQGYPGYASANEIWAYESAGGGGGGSWSLAGETRYLYDGKLVVQERNSSNTPLVSYARGKDLSGSLEGAGGIGGLLARSDGYSGGTWPWST